MTTYTLRITNAMTRNEGELTDILTMVEWVLSGEQDGATFELPGKTTMGPVDPQDFTPYSQLTPQQVIDWVNAIEDTETGQFPGLRGHINMVVTRMAAEAALASKPLPWAPAPTPSQPEESQF
jgi:hypothetical protein